MSEYSEIVKADELKDGQMKAFRIKEHEILVARVEGKFFAANNRCPHLGGKLAEGKLEGTIVTCPRHASQFDLEDGRVIRWTDWSGVVSRLAKLIRSPRPIVTHQVKVEGNKVLVEV